MNRDELLASYATGERDFRSANLIRANLEDASLGGANLSSANLEDANLEDANLIRANLIRASLGGANLSGANLEDASLGGANLEDANLIGANLGFGGLKGYWTVTRIGSDCAELQVAYTADEIRIKRGCSGWLTPDEFLERVQNVHGDNLHGKVYRATVDYIKARVALELAEEGAA